MSTPLSLPAARISVVGGYILAGSSAVSGRLLLSSMPGSSATLLSILLGFLVLVPFAVAEGLPPPREIRRALPHLLLQALLGTAAFRFFLMSGLAYTSAATAGLVTSMVPGTAVLLAAFFLGERPDRYNLAALILTAGGLVAVCWPRAPFQDYPNAWAGNLLVFGAVLCEAGFMVLSKGHKTSLGPAVRALAVLGSALVFTVPWVTVDQAWISLASPSAWPWAALGWAGIFVTGLSYLLFYRGVSVLPAKQTAILGGLVPLTGVVLPVLVLGEPVTGTLVLGGILVTGGIAVESFRGPGPTQGRVH